MGPPSVIKIPKTRISEARPDRRCNGRRSVLRDGHVGLGGVRHRARDKVERSDLQAYQDEVKVKLDKLQTFQNDTKTKFDSYQTNLDEVKAKFDDAVGLTPAHLHNHPVLSDNLVDFGDYFLRQFLMSLYQDGHLHYQDLVQLFQQQ